MVRESGACWLITAAHVINDGGGPFRLVMEGTPPVEGEGVAMAPFWVGLDVAVGVVGGGARNACTVPLAALERGWPNVTGLMELRLANVSAQGRLSYDQMRIDAVPDHKSFTSRFTGTAASGRRGKAWLGRSGAFLFFGDRPLGMTVTKPDEGVHGFIRIEEIAMNVARFIGWKGDSLIAGAAPSQVRQPAGFEVRVQSATLVPATLETRAEDVLSDGAPFLFKGTGEIVLEIPSEARQELRGVRIVSKGGEARPKDVTILTTSSHEGRGTRIPFAYGVMPPDGVFETAPRSAVPMRRVIVAIGSAWGTGVRRIDRIELF